jgi:hypothetical protein
MTDLSIIGVKKGNERKSLIFDTLGLDDHVGPGEFTGTKLFAFRL